MRISSADGIPGVGVVPGLACFFSSAGLGIPGVVAGFGEDPFAAGTFATFAGDKGVVEMPAGKFAGTALTGIATFAFVTFAFLFAEFPAGPPDELPQPAPIETRKIKE